MSVNLPPKEVDDLRGRSILELHALKNIAEALIFEKRDEQIRTGFESCRSIAAELDMTLDQLVEHGKKLPDPRKRKPVEPRYRSDTDHDDTWTGRGKKPRWLISKIEEGAKLEDFKI